MSNPNHPAKPTKKINYRAEVRKVFPRAVYHSDEMRIYSSGHWAAFQISCSFASSKDAWAEVYKDLQREMKR